MSRGDVETYYAMGAWHSRIEGEASPFATGGTKAEQVATGAEEARRRRCDHIIKNAYGRVDDQHSYRRSPHQATR
ncbi:hypothetical protein Kfla_3974 [Kribbella flavida DSM 17836]|uniref:DUF2188 domain-containing protein n=1 Tax=Kribbella flavida (strain DSM 17836 / JCM 10339 / NBRC 14399) TaxID=479435 RepID=D2PR77_KRIFD|nr:DUF2188 domain-containing protein [Kribbella flavida]ADB33025.1 hypothetical protein Kfla_3974 [Kribbella flavida DSM 17836]